MKMLTFLKGILVKIQFNKAQLSRPQLQSLIEVLDVLQSQNENELVVTPVEFPLKLKVKLDNDIEMLLGWDADKQSYAGLTTPEPEPEPEPTPEPTPEPELTPNSLPEIGLAEVIVRVEALARALVDLSKPLNTEQRIEVWIRFCVILSKELWK